MLLAGDIGGTKADLSIIPPQGNPRKPLKEAILSSADYPSLEALIHTFLSETDVHIKQASLCVAGPVVDGRATLTNLAWQVDEAQVAAALGISHVHILNDLECVAYAVRFLEPEDLYALNSGTPVVGGAVVIIAPGTGLGEAMLTRDGAYYRTHPSEGGHADFAPTDSLQLGLLRYLWPRLGHVSYEHVCSGLGLPHIYAYLRDSGYAEEPAWLSEQLSTVEDTAPIIIEHALSKERPSELCRVVLDTFVSILGAEAGNLALKMLATGGVYVAGGIPPRILPALEGQGFMRSFTNKGRLSGLLNRIPVWVILNLKAALLGAAFYGLEQFSGSE